MKHLWPDGWLAAVEQGLSLALDRPTLQSDEYLPPSRLLEGMRHAVLSGGKRLRPLLVLESARFCSHALKEDFVQKDALPAAIAVEFVHAYSLVHDDLPALDNDDFRRGKPTVHKAFDEATAVLVGDALLTDAFEVICESGVNTALQCKELARAAGSFGMVGGQMQDIMSEGAQAGNAEALNEEKLISIHMRKTARLICGACTLGALSSGANLELQKAMANFGTQLGLAFQIADDILDVAGDFEKRGKLTGQDAANDKLTFVSLYGLEGAKERAESRLQQALKSLSAFSDVERLNAIAKFAIERDR